jgi:hypothetical protein
MKAKQRTKKHFTTLEQVAFLAENVNGRAFEELRIMFNERFNLNLTLRQIYGACYARGLKSDFKPVSKAFLEGGKRTRFQKGIVPWDKGKKGFMGANRTSFQKGHRPHNWKPVGSEKIAEGYTYVKIEEPNKWDLKHHLIYKKYHKTDIPKGHKLIFADKNPFNFAIENLLLISNAEHMIMLQEGLRSDIPEITKTGANIAKLMNIVYKKKGGKKK